MSTHTHDYEALLWAESADIGTLLDEIDDADFDHASLCDGWRVRDVMSHMVLGHSTPMFQMVGMLAKYRFNVPKASRHGSVEWGSAHTPDEIREAWRGVVDGHLMKGIAKVIPNKEGFIDHVIHQQDIRRPLEMPRTIPEERLVAGVDGTSGDGPEVTGPAEALLLLASGRPAPIDEVTGAGVATLKERIAA